MITNSDIAKLKAVFATKDDLKGFAKKDDLKALATKDDLKGLENRFEDKVTGFKDEILTEIQNLRADVAIVTGYRDMIEQHETDIDAIKKRLKLPAS